LFALLLFKKRLDPFSPSADYQAFLDAGGHSETGCPKICGVAARVEAEKIMELIWMPSEMVP